ncbi:transcriptional activator [Chrysochromulina tobinii]|uniref:Nuclear transcription factor Y subunit n=1 Tax=Chrysochromulina tobinii TaxID=1460289 RepID=A0A0M0LSD5_9EUKA|nr:transcriptional activator [Chrysochromulina tobinii]|eukprot:KOO53906.1 transcriptional activator [Chrysochromulina sp. CCMP291]
MASCGVVPRTAGSEWGNAGSEWERELDAVLQEVDTSAKPILYVRASQYHRICQRRLERGQREAIRPAQPRQKYLHESRHLHALQRARGHKGRFTQQKGCAAEVPTDASHILAAPMVAVEPMQQ